MPEMSEEWVVIQEFPDYLVSNFGNVYCPRLERLISQSMNTGGYPQVRLAKLGVFRTSAVHRLVAFAFVDGHFPGAVVNHIDGTRHNNMFWNLEWVTRNRHREARFVRRQYD